jgi:hypothetical protein
MGKTIHGIKLEELMSSERFALDRFHTTFERLDYQLVISLTRGDRGDDPGLKHFYLYIANYERKSELKVEKTSFSYKNPF